MINIIFLNKLSSIRINTFRILSLFSLFLLLSCAVPEFAKPKKVSKDTPMNAKERARKNVEEGRGVSLKGVMGGNKSTNYEFSTSNPLWRLSLIHI